MKCSNCGLKNQKTIAFNSIIEKKTKHICLKCSSKEMEYGIEGLDELNDQIENIEELCLRYENLINLIPKQPSVPVGLESFAFTPLSAYEAAQTTLGVLKTRKLELISSTRSEHRLRYELQQALKIEDFERSAIIMAKIEVLKSSSN